MTKILPLLLATLLGLATGSHAATLSSTSQLGFDFTDWDSTEVGSESRVLQVQRFDPTQGTLTGISLAYAGWLRTAFTGFNDEQSAVQLAGEVSGDLHFLLPGGLVLDLNLANAASALTPAQQGYTFEVLALASGLGVALNLSDFIGTGSLLVNTVANGFGQLTSGGGNGNGGTLTEADARLTVTYTFTPQANPAPEPGSVVLVSLALAAAALSLKRRRC